MRGMEMNKKYIERILDLIAEHPYPNYCYNPCNKKWEVWEVPPIRRGTRIYTTSHDWSNKDKEDLEQMTDYRNINIIDDMINAKRRSLKANLEKLKDNIGDMLEEFDELDGYGLYKTWKYSINLPDLIIIRTSSIMDLDLAKKEMLELEED